jgi:hypothetical protein
MVSRELFLQKRALELGANTTSVPTKKGGWQGFDGDGEGAMATAKASMSTNTLYHHT